MFYENTQVVWESFRGKPSDNKETSLGYFRSSQMQNGAFCVCTFGKSVKILFVMINYVIILILK